MFYQSVLCCVQAELEKYFKNALLIYNLSEKIIKYVFIYVSISHLLNKGKMNGAKNWQKEHFKIEIWLGG